MMDAIRDDLEQFEANLRTVVKSDVPFIEAIGDDLLAAGGKRLRPTLAFLANHALGGVTQHGMTVALSVELLHSASLLHDDLIDDADTRRGAEAAFRRYGNVVSVMSGDFLLARVLGLLADANHADFTRRMSETAAKVCEGEVRQFQMAALETWSMDEYYRVIDGKTADLLATAVAGPAILNHENRDVVNTFERFGLAYGRAFQLQDDRLDLMGTAEELGKPVGGDLREGKATHSVLQLIERGHEEAIGILRRHASEASDVERMRQLVKGEGADDLTVEAITQEIAAAQEALAGMPEGPEVDALGALVDRELQRLR